MFLPTEYERTMRRCNRMSALLLFAALLFVPASSFAAPEDSEQSESQEFADAPFPKVVEAAQKAYSNEEYDRAIRLLVRAYSMRSNARLLFNIAKSYEKKNLCGTALVYYRAYINHPGTEKKLMDSAEKNMETADECEAYSDDLAGRLIVETNPEGARVSIDGEPHGQTPTEVAPLEAGSHKLEIRKEGYETVSIELQMNSGEKEEINQILQEQQEVATSDTDDDVDEGDSDPEGTGRSSFFWPIHPAALALGGGGIGGLTVGAVYDLAVIPSTDDKRRQVDRNSDEFQRLTDQRDNQETVALIGYLGGGLLLTSGVVWHIIDVASEPSASEANAAERSPNMRWSASPRSVGLQIQFF